MPIMGMDEIRSPAPSANGPTCPRVYGWLGLDRRGNWSISRRAHRQPGAGVSFIARNYGRDEIGRWFFQNGPQRCFVTLAYVPYVYRTLPLESGGCGLSAHTPARQPRHLAPPG